MKIRLLILVLLLIAMPLFSQYFLADDLGNTIQPGERVYIYNTSELSGYSVDYEKAVFFQHTLITEKNRIYIGTLKEKISPGFTLPIYFSTSIMLDTLILVVSPRFLTINLANKNMKIGDSLSGEVLFKHNEIMSGNGIDSLFFIIHPINSSIEYPIKIFSNDSLLGFDYSSGFFNFEFPLMYEAGEYCINLIVFSSYNSDTLNNICGFSLDYRRSKEPNLYVIDSEILSNAEHLSSFIQPLQSEIIYSFFHNIDRNMLDKRKHIVFFVDSINYFFKNSLFFSKLINTNQSNIFLFTPFANLDFLTTIDTHLFTDTINGYTISENQDINISQDININSQYSHLFVNDYIYDSTTLIVNRNNFYLCLFIPKIVNSSYIEFLSNFYSYTKLNKLLGRFYSIEIFDNKEYNEFCIDVFEISGKFLNRIKLGYLERGKNILNINKLSNVIPELKNGLFIYKILRSEKCIKQGIFIKSSHF